MDSSAPDLRRRRTGGRSARVRSAVLDATARLLVEKGADALSVAEIAQRSGVHETSIYRRWGTRENLGLEAALSRVELEIPIPDTGTLRGDLMSLARAIVVFQESPYGKALVQAGMRSDLPAQEASRRAFWGARHSAVGAVLDRAEARGELRAGVDAGLVLDTLVGLLAWRTFLTREATDERVLERAVDLIVSGIGTAG